MDGLFGPAPVGARSFAGPVLSQKRGRYPTIPTSLYFGSGQRHL